MVKVAQVQYEGKQYAVLGKENVIKLLRETQSVRALMEIGQLEKLVRHEGNFVNNYTPSVLRAGLLRQHLLASIQTGMTLIVNENHDLVRFQSLVCYDVPELQRSLYTLNMIFLISRLQQVWTLFITFQKRMRPHAITIFAHTT